MVKQKGFRLSEETKRKFLELVKLYGAKSENHAFELIINDVHQIKKSKALVPYEELDKQTKELKMAYMKVGELQGIVNEKEKQIQRLENLLKEEKERKSEKKGFWARLFRL